ncbi:MAG: VCBS repeat-containing protein [Pseudohongiella sp.]|nr:VCBS repeat-containing protein [Pseudohongiella sp.]
MSNLFEVGSLKISPITSQYPPRWISQTYTVDLDGDGADDYLVPGGTYPGDNGPVAQPGLMIFGDGNGGFSLAANDRFPLTSAQLADLNQDGRVDLIIGPAFSTSSPPRPVQMLWNTGGDSRRVR